MTVENEDFPLDRYNFSRLIEYVKSLEEIPETVTDVDTDIEFYGSAVSREKFIEVLESFSLLDNLAQEDAQREYVLHREFGVDCYRFEPSWVEIGYDKVTVGYVGTYVNTDFEMEFAIVGNKWAIAK